MQLPKTHMTKTALAVEALRGAILRGEISAQAPLTVTRLATQLGMSPTPVREALRTLEAEGLLHVKPHHTASVTRYSAQDIRDIFELRIELEARAARLAAPHLDAAQLDQLEREQQAMREAAGRGEIDRLNSLNAAWHLSIYAAAENRVLLDVVQHLWKKFMVEVNWIESGSAGGSLDEHDALLAALGRHDAEAAAQVVVQHISRSQRIALERQGAYAG